MVRRKGRRKVESSYPLLLQGYPEHLQKCGGEDPRICSKQTRSRVGGGGGGGGGGLKTFGLLKENPK